MAKLEEMNSQIFVKEGKGYRYWVAGKASSPALILLYGYTGVHEDFLEVVSLLKDKYFVVIPEYPGWNNVPRFSKELTIHNYAEYFKTLFDFLQLSRVNLIAHCLGGVTAIEFTYLYPKSVSRLILISTPYLKDTWVQKMYEILARRAKRMPRLIRPLFFLWRSRVFDVPADFFIIKVKNFSQKLKRIKDHIVKQPKQREDAVEEEWISFVNFNFKKATKITTPVHLIHGEKDMLISLEQTKKMQRLFSNATLDVLSEAGHVPSVETPSELARLLLKRLY